MTIKECIDIINKNIYLIGKKVEYENEILTVIDIFSAPTGGLEKIFLHDYFKNGRDSEKALNKFLGRKDLDVYILCQRITGEEVLLRLSDVTIL